LVLGYSYLSLNVVKNALLLKNKFVLTAFFVVSLQTQKSTLLP
jgi:hypothetical protein